MYPQATTPPQAPSLATLPQLGGPSWIPPKPHNPSNLRSQPGSHVSTKRIPFESKVPSVSTPVSPAARGQALGLED